MERTITPREAAGREYSPSELREFIDNFSYLWFDLTSDTSEIGQQELKAASDVILGQPRLAFNLLNGLAGISHEEGWERPVQIASILDALALLADQDISEDTLGLLYDPGSPLWQNSAYLEPLGKIIQNIPTKRLSAQILDIAEHLSTIPEEASTVYSSHIGRLATLLGLAMDRARDTEDAEILSEAGYRLADIRDTLRPYILANLYDIELPEETSIDDLYGKLAIYELDNLPEDKDLSNLIPMYNLIAIPGRSEDERFRSPENTFRNMTDRHRLSQLETNPHPLTPTIGIEIEVRDNQIQPEGFAQWPEERKTEHLIKTKYQYENTEFAGIPADKDDHIAFHEFAFSPKNYYLTLSREVQMLLNRDFIPESQRPSVMHLTLGGVHARLDENKENECFALARIMEATLWSSSHHRLLRKYPKTQTTAHGESSIGWDCKGLAGVLDKKNDIFYNYRVNEEMVEFRTFQLKSLTGINRTLASFQTLGAAMAAAQRLRKERGADSPAANLSNEEFELANIWILFENNVKNLFRDYGLMNPMTPYTSMQPENDTEYRYLTYLGPRGITDMSGFYDFIDLLKQADQNPESRGGEFVKIAKRLVGVVRGEVSKIIFDR